MNYGIVTYCSAGYQGCLDFSLPSWIESPARSIWVFTDGPIRLPSHPKIRGPVFFSPGELDRGAHCARKAEALDVMLEDPGGEHYVLLDADCRVVGDLGDVFEMPFDVAPTLRGRGTVRVVTPETFEGKPSAMWNDVSAGALFVRHTPQAHRFVKAWVAAQNGIAGQASFGRCPANRDQQALTRTCQRFLQSRESNVVPVNANLYNSFAETDTATAREEWLSRLAERRLSVRVLHYAFGQWRDNRLVHRTMGMIHGTD